MAALPIALPAVQAPPQVTMPAYVAPPAPVQNPMAQPGMAPSVDTNAIVSALMGAYQTAQGALAAQGPGVVASPQALDTIRAIPGVLGRLGATGAVTPADAMSYASQSNRTQEMANAEHNQQNAEIAGAEAGYAGKVYGANTGLTGKEVAGGLGYEGTLARGRIAAEQAKQDARTAAFARVLSGGQQAMGNYLGRTAILGGQPQYASTVASGIANLQASQNKGLIHFMPAGSNLPNMGG